MRFEFSTRLPLRFWSKIRVLPSGCWEWTASKNGDGYGMFLTGSRRDGTCRPSRAHRVAYEALIAPIPSGLTLDHLCRKRDCVNPADLEPVTASENVLRGIGLGAKNKRKSHCKRGHPFNAENTYCFRRRRLCRICRREAKRYISERNKQ